jgi:hypothetical protein
MRVVGAGPEGRRPSNTGAAAIVAGGPASGAKGSVMAKGQMRSNKEKKKPKQDKKAPAAAASFDKGVAASPSGGMGAKKKG